MTELFDLKELRRPLSSSQRRAQLFSVVNSARLGRQFFYTMKQAAGILHWSYDQIFDAIHFYRLDAVVFLNLVRIPWWSLAEYLADPADDIDRATAEYLQSIPHREGGFSRAG